MHNLETTIGGWFYNVNLTSNTGILMVVDHFQLYNQPQPEILHNLTCGDKMHSKVFNAADIMHSQYCQSEILIKCKTSLQQQLNILKHLERTILKEIKFHLAATDQSDRQ